MPKSLIFVLVIFVWDSGQVLDSIVRYSIKIDYYLWESLGLSWVFFVIQFASLSLLVAALTVLWEPRPYGLKICLVQAGWMAVYGIISAALIFKDIPGVREVYMLGREIRGLSVRPEAADLIFTQSGILGTLIFSLTFALLIVLIIWRNRWWFIATENTTS